MLRRAVLATVFLSSMAVTSPAADNKPKAAIVHNPDQYVELRDVSEVKAEQGCNNWAWAAAVEAILRKQGVQMDQRTWVMKQNGGLPCIDRLDSLEQLKRIVDGDYALADQRRVRVTARYTAGLPAATDTLLRPLAFGRPYILFWSGRPFLVYGAVWDEQVYQTGQKLVLIKRLQMIDPTATGEKRKITFERDKDQASALGAMFDVEVEEISASPWTPPHNPALDPVPNPARTPPPNPARKAPVPKQ